MFTNFNGQFENRSNSWYFTRNQSKSNQTEQSKTAEAPE